MKTSSIVASVLFGSMAAAAPMLNKRAYVTHTSTLIQTEVTYTTVYADEPAAKPSASPAFFEKPTGKPANAPSAAPTQPAPVAPVKPSSAVSPVPVKPSSQAPQPSTPAPAPTVAPAKPSVEAVAPKPSTTPAAAAPAPAPSSAKPATPAATPATGGSSGGSGQVHSGGSMTIHPFNGNLGSCGKPIADTDMTVALADDLYGASTYDVMTGTATNKWCGQKINITYKGKTVAATIMDKCSGCTNGGLDVSKALWESLTDIPSEQGGRLYDMTWTTA